MSDEAPEVNADDTPILNESGRPDFQAVRHEVVDFFKMVAWFLIIFLTLRAYVIEGYEVHGPSMDPNLQTYERILVFKLPHNISRMGMFGWMSPIEPGDIIVFDSPDVPNKRYVKRVIAVGEKVRGNTAGAEDVGGNGNSGVAVEFDHGKIFVDNHLIEEDYLSQDARVATGRQTLTLGPGEYYVLGDNRNMSKDSRSFDAIQDSAIIGKAVIRFWPPRRISLLP